MILCILSQYPLKGVAITPVFDRLVQKGLNSSFGLHGEHTVQALVSEFQNRLKDSDVVLMERPLTTGLVAGINGLTCLPKHVNIFLKV